MHSGRTGEVLWSVLGQDYARRPPLGFFRGDRLSNCFSLGDFDGDGIPDIGMTASRGVIRLHISRLYVRSGDTGRLITVFENDNGESRFGLARAAAADIDGDGRSDILTAGPGWEPRDAGKFESAFGRVYALRYNPDRTPFIRGDANADGVVTIADGIDLLGYLFRGRGASCLEALDIDRDLRVVLSDAVYLLGHLFQRGISPTAPYPSCGRFSSFRPQLGCEASSCP